MSDEAIKLQLLKAIPKVESGYSFAERMPLGIGGPCRFFCEAADTIELVQAIKAACDAGIPYRVVGELRSIIIGDAGYDGLIIQNNSQSYAVSQEQSQVVVDSGMAVRKLVTIAANLELAGLIPLYAGGGSVGGALFYNSLHARGSSQSFADSLRSLTLLMPPTKIKPDPSIVRFKGSWLTARVDAGQTKLLQAESRDAGRMPVILTAQIQLTSLRSDEIRRRFQNEMQEVVKTEPKASDFSHYYGKLFMPPENASLEAAFQKARVYNYAVAGLSMDKHLPNYAKKVKKFGRKSSENVSVRRLLTFCEALEEKVLAATGVNLERAFQVIGEQDQAIFDSF